ncbi:MAG TPA: acyl-ACP thioesterase domain-containing protein [Solirubrobacteraceae bacterium]|nr:acyl-ACP thioesterase domain-containing protein [Solirubrobacteraceae bacterium]
MGPATELVAPPAHGRVFRHAARAGLADVAPPGRARLDAIARWLQDAALADVQDAGLAEGLWIVRRLRIAVARFPAFGEELEVATFCSGVGRFWAERRTTVAGAGGARVEAGALWVHLAADGARPAPMPPRFDAVYGPAAAGRRVRARLRHPAAPPPDAERRPWRFRAADLDLADHVNNAVYWQVLEEDLAGELLPGGLDAEIEHRAPADAGEAQLARADGARWVLGADGAVLASFVMAPRPPRAPA